MPACQYKYESESPRIRFECNEPTRTNGKFCFFHDEDHYDEYEEDAAKRFEEKLLESISENKSLLCIGYYLPNVNFLLLLGEKSLPQRAYFTKVTFYKGASFAFATFSETADFTKATFSGAADFSEAAFSKATFIWTKFLETVVFFQAVFKERAFFSDVTFSDKAKFMSTRFQNNADFLNNEFKDEGHFHYTVFEHPNKVTFDNCSLSNVSFADSDITRIRFGDKVTWRGGKKGFGIMEEDSLRKRAKRKAPIRNEMITLELVLSIYRNLRENYEFRLRYDDAGRFFIKEMELKRKYREVPSISDFKLRLINLCKKLIRDQSPYPEVTYRLEENCRFRRHFSLTGLYYHFSRYGESISRPTAIGAITLFLSTLFWATQSNPLLEPNFSFLSDSTNAIVADNSSATTSNYVGSAQFGNGTQWLKAFERSFGGFLPLLPAGDFKVGIIDYVIKIVGGALTFGLLIIAFRRKFERKYTR